MRIRLYNARILTMEGELEPFWGEIWIKDDRIDEVWKTPLSEKAKKQGAEISWEREIDCLGNMLMPGFKDAHTHSPMTFLRSMSDDLPLREWLQKKIFPMEAKLDEESIYHFGKLAILEYLTSGITGIFDMYLKPRVMADACVDLGMRCCLVSGLNNFTSSVAALEREYDELNHVSPLIKFHAGFHAEYTCSKKLLQELSELVHERKLPVFTHLSETSREVLECRERHGMTPVVFLDGLGLFDYGGGGYHCIHFSEEDVRIFERRHLTIVTNPASNLKLASGIAPVPEFLRRGIPVAIGTDGPASNNCLDFFREMFLVSGLSKVKEGDATCANAGEVLKMATINGAMAMGFTDCDVLAKGKAADLIMIDLNQPNMQPIHHVANNLVYSGSKSNVKMTMIAGKILYEKGEFFVGETAEEIYLACDEQIKRILGGKP